MASGIIVLDNFFDEENLALMINSLTAKKASMSHVLINGNTRNSILIAMGYDFTSRPEASSSIYLCPAKISSKNVSSHVDHSWLYSKRFATTFVGYLKGGGSVALTSVRTGEEYLVEIKPNRAVIWLNERFEHAVLADDSERLMLGPLAIDSDRAFVSVGCDPRGASIKCIDSNSRKARASFLSSQFSWQQTATSQRWRGIASSSDGTKLAAVVENGYIWTSTNSGSSWTETASSQNWWGIASSSDGSKLAAFVFTTSTAPGYIRTSSDSGSSWTQTASSQKWIGIASSSDGSKLAACVFQGYIMTATEIITTITPSSSNPSSSSPSSTLSSSSPSSNTPSSSSPSSTTPSSSSPSSTPSSSSPSSTPSSSSPSSTTPSSSSPSSTTPTSSSPTSSPSSTTPSSSSPSFTPSSSSPSFTPSSFSPSSTTPSSSSPSSTTPSSCSPSSTPSSSSPSYKPSSSSPSSTTPSSSSPSSTPSSSSPSSTPSSSSPSFIPTSSSPSSTPSSSSPSSTTSISPRYKSESQVPSKDVNGNFVAVSILVIILSFLLYDYVFCQLFYSKKCCFCFFATRKPAYSEFAENEDPQPPLTNDCEIISITSMNEIEVSKTVSSLNVGRQMDDDDAMKEAEVRNSLKVERNKETFCSDHMMETCFQDSASSNTHVC